MTTTAPTTTPTNAPLIPREVLFGNPTRMSPAISPDGTRLAWIAPHDGVLNVWVRTVGSDDERVVTSDDDRGIRSFTWAYDGRHLLYIQDRGGDENWRLYATDLTDGTTRDLTPFEGVQAQIVRLHEDFPDELLVALNRDNPELHDVYRLHLGSGELEHVVENPGFVGWIADDSLTVRAGVAPTSDGGLIVMVRSTVDEDWRPLHQVGQEDALATSPIAFSSDGTRLLMITSKDANAGRLVWLDVATGDADVLAADDQYDVTTAWLHPDTHEPQLVGFLRERLDWTVLDDDLADDVAALSALDPGEMDLVGRDLADDVWVVAYDHDDGPVSYYLYQRATRQATFLFVHRPELNDYELAEMVPFSLEARDGLTLHGYITFPPGVERAGLPAVLNVHGGPWARDTWGYRPEAQWFANRGYACVQVNFRGSTGYGKEFVNAGDKEWGAKMHTDLLDTVDFVVEQGWVDRERVAIYGGSYGGYAALVGATFTPDVFACAVDIVGPSNLSTLLASIPPYWAPMIAQFHTRMGDPESDADLLRDRSPLFKADHVSIPLLIAQGANDPRVKQAESEQIVAALQEKGIDHTYLLFEDEGHGFAKPENRLRFYAEAERFLAEHLGGRHED
jgi:dipeptidyl aminopeptidase/acylaminoacyl peptidase